MRMEHGRADAASPAVCGLDDATEALAQAALVASEAEAALIDRAVAGDTGAFAQLYDLHLTRVYRHVYYRVGSRADAEDLTQQVFLQAWRAIGRYRRSGAPFVAWLLTIAHNLVVSFYRQTKVEPALEMDPVAHDRWANPEREVVAAYDRLAVRSAILRLKPEQQQIVTMRFLESFDYGTIAAAVGKTEGNVRVILHRALSELRRLLEREVNA